MINSSESQNIKDRLKMRSEYEKIFIEMLVYKLKTNLFLRIFKKLIKGKIKDNSTEILFLSQPVFLEQKINLTAVSSFYKR